ncbi:LacI family transcriptional regulator, partial [Streptomyces sp. SID10116]|nr:LacI family transcriptional regulator [Streptomyces sp. SID10116]
LLAEIADSRPAAARRLERRQLVLPTQLVERASS